MLEDGYPALDVGFFAEEERGATVVDRAVEENFQRGREGRRAGAGHAAADDLDFIAGVRLQSRLLLSHAGGVMERDEQALCL